MVKILRTLIVSGEMLVGLIIYGIEIIKKALGLQVQHLLTSAIMLLVLVLNMKNKGNEIGMLGQGICGALLDS